MGAKGNYTPDQSKPIRKASSWFHRNADYPVDVVGKAKGQGIAADAVHDVTTQRVFGGAVAVDGGLSKPVESPVAWQFWEGKAWTGRTPARTTHVIAVRLGAAAGCRSAAVASRGQCPARPGRPRGRQGGRVAALDRVLVALPCRSSTQAPSRTTRLADRAQLPALPLHARLQSRWRTAAAVQRRHLHHRQQRPHQGQQQRRAADVRGRACHAGLPPLDGLPFHVAEPALARLADAGRRRCRPARAVAGLLPRPFRHRRRPGEDQRRRGRGLSRAAGRLGPVLRRPASRRSVRRRASDLSLLDDARTRLDGPAGPRRAGHFARRRICRGSRARCCSTTASIAPRTKKRTGKELGDDGKLVIYPEQRPGVCRRCDESRSKSSAA